MANVYTFGASTTSTVSGIVQKYYDKLFLKIADKKLVHKQLGQHSTQVGKGEGGYGSGLVAWTRWVSLPTVSSGQGEGLPTTGVSMTATQVTATPAQYDAAVSISDILAYTSFGDIMKGAVERLAYNAGISIDTVVRNVISTTFVASVNGSAVAYWSAVPANANLLITQVRQAARGLAGYDAPEQDGGGYAAVIHPHVSYDLMGDTTTGGWIDANKYSSNQSEKLMEGEIGKLLGIRFLQSTNAYIRGSSYDVASAVVASTTLYVTSFFGKDAFGVTDLQSLKTYIKGFGSGGVADPTDKVSTAGWKTSFAAAVLNSTFGMNVTTTVSTTA